MAVASVRSEEWNGKTVFVLASGPSLTGDDVALVAEYSHEHCCPVVVTNTTYQLALWADALFFHDVQWWRIYGDHVKKHFSGSCVTVAKVVDPCVTHINSIGFAYGNSGGGAINLAIHRGAKRIILLGLDGQYAKDGRRHWHQQHKKLGDAHSLPRWVTRFPSLAEHAKRSGVEVVNASRETALTCFARGVLEDLLA
jgi:hypothetical protein